MSDAITIARKVVDMHIDESIEGVNHVDAVILSRAVLEQAEKIRELRQSIDVFLKDSDPLIKDINKNIDRLFEEREELQEAVREAERVIRLHAESCEGQYLRDWIKHYGLEKGG